MKPNGVVSLLFLTILMDVVLLGDCKTYKPLQWSPLNPLFNTSAYRINVLAYSKLNIICPNHINNPVAIELPLSKENMFENIWNVDKKSFETCVVNTTNKKNTLLFKCNKPLSLTYHSMIFLPTTNIEGQTEFEIGKEYYFIDTSNGSESSLTNTAMGHCLRKNMRFIIYVCKHKNDPLCIENGPDLVNKSERPSMESTHPPTKKKSDNAAAASRETDCFISVKERLWLIVVCVLGLLVLLLLMCHAYLCHSRRKKSQTTLADKKPYLTSKEQQSMDKDNGTEKDLYI